MSSEPVAVVGGGKIQLRPLGDDARRVDGFVAAVIMRLDVQHVHGPGHIRHLIEIAGIVGQVRIVGNALPVAFEMPDINRIEAQQGGEQPPVRLGNPIAREIALPAETLFQLVERLSAGRGDR